MRKEDLKQYLESGFWKQGNKDFLQNALFSYKILRREESGLSFFRIHQNESEFSITLGIEERQENPIVKSADLHEDEGFKHQSPALGDAALIETILQGIHFLYGRYLTGEDAVQINFQVKKHEYELFNAFSSLFRPFEYRFGLVHFILDISQEEYQAFKEKAESILEKICQELWKEQRHDHIVKHYFQKSRKGHLEPGDLNQEILKKNAVVPFLLKPLLKEEGEIQNG